VKSKRYSRRRTSESVRGELPRPTQGTPSNNFHCQTPFKNAKFDLFGNDKCQLANLVANRAWLIVTVLQARHAKYDLQKFGFTNRVVNTWNNFVSGTMTHYVSVDRMHFTKKNRISSINDFTGIAAYMLD